MPSAHGPLWCARWRWPPGGRRRARPRLGAVRRKVLGSTDPGGCMGLNIADIFETVVATVPDNPALVVRTGDGHDEVRLTFAELDARVNRLAHALAGARRRQRRPRRLPPLRRQPVRRDHARGLQAARGPGERELPLRRRGADVPLRQRRPEGRRHRARPRGPRAPRAAATLAWPCPVVVADERYEALLARAARHRARRRRALARRPLRALDRWHHRHAQGRHVAPGRHLPVGASAAAATRCSASSRCTNLDDVAARVAQGHRRSRARSRLCPLMHGGGFWLAFSAILSGSFAC